MDPLVWVAGKILKWFARLASKQYSSMFVDGTNPTPRSQPASTTRSADRAISTVSSGSRRQTGTALARRVDADIYWCSSAKRGSVKTRLGTAGRDYYTHPPPPGPARPGAFIVLPPGATNYRIDLKMGRHCMAVMARRPFLRQRRRRAVQAAAATAPPVPVTDMGLASMTGEGRAETATNLPVVDTRTCCVPFPVGLRRPTHFSTRKRYQRCSSCCCYQIINSLRLCCFSTDRSETFHTY